ncbi:FeoB-associated Cys-rich membrane protein [Cellvibrio mixtus]|uniref:FeoB-associated Cys-rich membrane protein n=1 Tax=Cellvibrio mixtus TaxID=39650 RepID=UPI000586882E|nr:FeoB-associated Cys-rich membrane protein [Cellvibrio mixtus]
MWQNIPWQEIVVGVCVLGAAIFLLRRWIFPGKKAAGCGGCSGCAKTTDSGCSTPANNSKL